MAFCVVNILVFFIIENYAISMGYENLCIFNKMLGYDLWGCEEEGDEWDVLNDEDGVEILLLLLSIHKNRHF